MVSTMAVSGTIDCESFKYYKNDIQLQSQPLTRLLTSIKFGKVPAPSAPYTGKVRSRYMVRFYHNIRMHRNKKVSRYSSANCYLVSSPSCPIPQIHFEKGVLRVLGQSCSPVLKLANVMDVRPQLAIVPQFTICHSRRSPSLPVHEC